MENTIEITSKTDTKYKERCLLGLQWSPIYTSMVVGMNLLPCACFSGIRATKQSIEPYEQIPALEWL